MRAAEQLRYLVLGAQREGNRVLADGLRPLGVTPAQAEALRVLEDHGPMSLKSAGEYLVCETGSPSRLLATLVTTGLVERNSDPGDGRAIRLGLTRVGGARAEQIRLLETVLYAEIEAQTAALDLDAALLVLRTLTANRAAGRALDRRIRAEDDAEP